MSNATSTVLLIDDDSFSRKLLQMMLRQVGCQVVEAENGEEGIKVFQECAPTLILLDAKMPGMDGFECCRRIRQMKSGEHIPILMVTGLEDGSSVDEAFSAGATDYVTKPVQMPILTGRVRYLIQSFQASNLVRESEEKYRSLITSLQEVVFQLNAAGDLIFANPVWHKLTGYSLDKSLNQPFVSFLHPDEQKRHLALFQKAWEYPSQCYRYRSRCVTATGQIRWVDIQLCGNLDDQGNVLDIAGRLTDITDRTIREHYRNLEYAITRVLANAKSSETAIRLAIQAICGNLSFHGGEFWQLDNQTLKFRCVSQWHLKQVRLTQFADSTNTLSLDLDEGIPGKVWQSGEALWVADIENDSTFTRKEQAQAAGICSLLSFPIKHGPEALGLIIFFRQVASPPDEDLIRMLTLLGRQIGQYLKRWEAEQELQRQNERFRLELQRAAEYVEALLPDTNEPVSAEKNRQSCIAINTQYQPSSGLGGDAFDYAWLDDEHLMFHLLDVAGHGVKSALLSVSVLNILRKRTLLGADFYDPETVLAALNNAFEASDNGEDYFTFWYGVYNITTRELRFASAGHPPAVLAMPNADGYKTRHLGSDGIAIGLLPDFPFDAQQCEIPVGSSLYIFSDGVYEIPVDDNDQIWGLDAWTEQLRLHKYSQQGTLDPLLEEVRRINGEDTLEDDFSILEVCFG
ncbi:MAG: SpoIIE family protein phosphatase [Leptolyngbya sp. SIO3F4]|nr:SpoIIE family protein phosphatase [Leptolyngbya sp. SIO3F4]